MKIKIGDFVSKYFDEGDGTFTKWTYRVEELVKGEDNETVGARGFGVYTEVNGGCKDNVGEIFIGWDLLEGLVTATRTERRIWKESFEKSGLEWRKK